MLQPGCSSGLRLLNRSACMWSRCLDSHQSCSSKADSAYCKHLWAAQPKHHASSAHAEGRVQSRHFWCFGVSPCCSWAWSWSPALCAECSWWDSVGWAGGQPRAPTPPPVPGPAAIKLPSPCNSSSTLGTLGVWRAEFTLWHCMSNHLPLWFIIFRCDASTVLSRKLALWQVLFLFLSLVVLWHSCAFSLWSVYVALQRWQDGVLGNSTFVICLPLAKGSSFLTRFEER